MNGYYGADPGQNGVERSVAGSVENWADFYCQSRESKVVIRANKKWNTQQISRTDFRPEEQSRGGLRTEVEQCGWWWMREATNPLKEKQTWQTFTVATVIFCCCNNWFISERSVFDPVFILITFSFQFNSIEVYLYSTNSQQKPPQGDFYCRVKTQQ